MTIVNGKKHYKKDIKAAESLNLKGWNRYNGRNWQWYNIFYNANTGLVILEADNSGDCYGDYSTKYFNSPKDFREYAEDPYRCGKDLDNLLRDLDEENKILMDFVEKMGF